MSTSNKVGLYLDLINVDAMFEASDNPRVLQKISHETTKFKDLLFTTIDRSNPLIDNRPTCDCRATVADYGTEEVCEYCGSKVIPQTERSVTPNLFLGRPYQVESFVSPYVYSALRFAFDIGYSKNRYNAFTTLLSNSSSTNPVHKIIMNRMPAELLGYNNAVSDLPTFVITLADIILDLLYPKEKGIVSKEITKSLKNKTHLTEELLQAKELAHTIRKWDLPYKSHYLPVRNKILLTIEEGVFSNVSETTDKYGETIVHLNNMPFDESKMTLSQKARYRPEAGMVKFYEMYSDLRSIWYKEEGSKGGLMRTETITARSASVLRSVQSQIVDPHAAEEIHLPYSQSIVIFYAHLVHWYRDKYKWSAEKIMTHLETYTREYNEELWEAMNEILAVVTEMGGLAYALRYPSIYRTSGLSSYMTKIKKDPNDRTLGVSAPSLPANNGDFDGDEITVRIVMVANVAKVMKRLRLREAALDVSKEGEFAHIVAISQPTGMNWGNYLRGVDTPCKSIRNDG